MLCVCGSAVRGLARPAQNMVNFRGWLRVEHSYGLRLPGAGYSAGSKFRTANVARRQGPRGVLFHGQTALGRRVAPWSHSRPAWHGENMGSSSQAGLWGLPSTCADRNNRKSLQWGGGRSRWAGSSQPSRASLLNPFRDRHSYNGQDNAGSTC